MNSSNIKHKVIALFLAINFLSSIIPINLLFSNNGGPTSPEASSFEPVDASDMVNLNTGNFTYVMPLLEVPSPTGGYPISMSYHAGIAMDQDASWLGLGWNLNPGAINRSINGVPDDWKSKNRSTLYYNNLGVSKNINIDITFPGTSFGTYYSYASFQSTNGENSYSRSGVGFSGGFSHNIAGNSVGFSGRIGTDGAGVSIGSGNANISIYQSFVNGNTSANIGVSADTRFGNGGKNKGFGLTDSMFRSLGISLNTNGGSVISSPAGPIQMSGSSSNSNVTSKGTSFTIPLPFLSVSYSKKKHWITDVKGTIYSGSLYGADLNNLNAITRYYTDFDGYEANSEVGVNNETNYKSNFSSISYDSYIVNSQGLSGSIAPRFYENASLPSTSFVTNRNDEGGLINLVKSVYGGGFSKTILNNDLHFYFENIDQSYLRMKSNGWNNLPSTVNDIIDIDTSPETLLTSTVIDGDTFDNYNASKKRKINRNFINYYTNDQLQQNSSLIIEGNNFDRNNSVLPKDGIGAFAITSNDGKTYHYSIPVYQHEEFTRRGNKDESISNNFLENQQVAPYATHWLLTAITGPDYVDLNGNNLVDESDYGYWVEFDYGKWSDGFGWRSPNKTDFHLSINTKSYSWGVKEVYYLDKIKTKTHTAIFVKEERNDNKSYNLSIGSSINNPRVYDIAYAKKLFNDGSSGFHFVGLKGIVELNIPYTGDYGIIEKYFYYARAPSHNSLKLNKIVLLKNENVPDNIKNISTNNSPVISGRILIKEKFIADNANTNEEYEIEEIAHDRTFQGRYHSNVITEADLIESGINFDDLNIRTVQFSNFQNYGLAPYINGGESRLKLNGVKFIGKNNEAITPGYRFKYYENRPNDRESMDAWGFAGSGYEKSNSLSEIITPTGSKINIQYESDDYYQEVAKVNTIFNSKLEIKFTGNENSTKYLEIRNDPDNSFEDNTNFQNFFQIGTTTKLDVHFWNNPSGSGHPHRIADISMESMVTEVYNNSVKFLLPQSDPNIQTTRKYETCQSQDWIFYSKFNEVVDKGWLDVENEALCQDPGDGNKKLRYRIYSNKVSYNNQGGGLRVSSININDGESQSFSNTYDYNIPNTSNSSGVTTYSPSIYSQEIKYASEIPVPNVNYEFVTIKNNHQNNKFQTKDVYQFEVLKPYVESTNSFSLGDLFSIERVSTNQSNVDVSMIEGRSIYYGGNSVVNSTEFVQKNRLSALGRLIKKETFNYNNQLLSSTQYNFENKTEESQGVDEESFSRYKSSHIISYNSSNPNNKYIFNLSTSRKILFPSSLESIKTSSGGQNIYTFFDKYDFNTGNVIETTTTDNKGLEIKSQIIPAYTQYPNMGSKVDDINNKNMLSQEAASYTFIKKDGTWKPIGVGITTWNNDWDYRALDGTISSPTNPTHKIWRKHKSFIWDGDIDVEGVYTGFSVGNDDGFNWDNPNASPVPWKKVSETTMYDHYSMPLEVKDINDNYASTKMWDDETKIFSTSNAKYTEHFTFNAEKIESYNGIDYLGDGIERLNEYALLNEEKSHTGKYSFPVNSWNENFNVILKSGEHREGHYRMSVWIHKDNYDKALIRINDKPLTPFNGEIVEAGNWVQLNHVMHFDTSEQRVYITSSDGRIYLDDFRLSPIESTVSTYVYNDYDELEATLGANNMATKYQYDDAGRLIRVWQEVADTPTIIGGFKKASEYRYNYSRNASGNTQDETLVDVHFETIFDGDGQGDGASVAKVVGPSNKLITFRYECIGGGTGIQGEIKINGLTIANIDIGDSGIISEYLSEDGEIQISVEHIVPNGSVNTSSQTRVSIIDAEYPGLMISPLQFSDKNGNPR